MILKMNALLMVMSSMIILMQLFTKKGLLKDENILLEIKSLIPSS